MKYAHIEKDTGKILCWYSDDVHGVWVEPKYEEKVISEETKDDNGNITKEKTTEKSLVKNGFYDISNIPNPSIEANEKVWQEAIKINANYYNNETKEFEVKDFSNFEEKINLALSKLKRNTNYEAPTTCLNIAWVGGYESAQMLNAKRTLCLEVGLESCTFTDNNDIDHSLSLDEAKEVCIKVAYEFEERRAVYKTKKRAIELCTTIKELEEIEI